ncbi:hypothetical protein OUZ56_004958 [Daphnia magna]|uniref:Uncharacterized protein n=1 Tax=Daphnia magna TaxID=35525 RepID=A0ABQ9YRL2_9CRUS|nr:hypothetical protein OUZ56_004958 [Daphnia magna]
MDALYFQQILRVDHQIEIMDNGRNRTGQMTFVRDRVQNAQYDRQVIKQTKKEEGLPLVSRNVNVSKQDETLLYAA